MIGPRESTSAGRNRRNSVLLRRFGPEGILGYGDIAGIPYPNISVSQYPSIKSLSMLTVFSLYALACLREGRLLPPRELWTMARQRWKTFRQPKFPDKPGRDS
jgi:hypothetical protein